MNTASLKPIAWRVYDKNRNTIVSESKGHWLNPLNESLTLCGRAIPRDKKNLEYWFEDGSAEGECSSCTKKATN